MDAIQCSLGEAHLSGIWEGCAVSPSSYLVRLFSPFFQSSFSVASHGRVPADVLLPIRCMPDSFEGRCIMPTGFSVRFPGSWLGESWVLALLIGFCFCTFALILLWSGCVVLLYARSYPIHRHTSCRLWWGISITGWPFLLWFGVVLLLMPGLFLVLCFVGFLFRFHPVVDLGLRNGLRSTFDSPMWDAYSYIVQFVYQHIHCVTTWREPQRRRTEKKNGNFPGRSSESLLIEPTCEIWLSVLKAVKDTLQMAISGHTTDWGAGKVPQPDYWSIRLHTWH